MCLRSASKEAERAPDQLSAKKSSQPHIQRKKRSREVNSDDDEPTPNNKKQKLTDTELDTLSAQEYDSLFQYVEDWDLGLPDRVSWVNRAKDNLVYWTRSAFSIIIGLSMQLTQQCNSFYGGRFKSPFKLFEKDAAVLVSRNRLLFDLSLIK